MTLELNKKKITVSPARLVYNQTRLKYLSLADSAAAKFGNAYHTNFKDMDELHARCTTIAESFINETVEVALRDLINLGIYDIDNDAFGAFLDPYATWPGDFHEVDAAYMEIVLNAEALDEYRTSRRQSRGRWVGGGFTVAGAIEGALKAGALNATTNALHGGFNLFAKGLSAVSDLGKKNELFENPQIQAYLIASVHRAVFNVHFALVNAVNRSQPGTFCDLVTEEAQTRAASLLQNVESGRLPEDAVETALLAALNLDPYNEKFYRLWFDSFGDQNGQLEEVEASFGMTVVASTKRDLLAARKISLDLSTPEACESSLKTLAHYAESIGYRGFAKEKNQIQALAKKLDQERRTVDGREYATLAEANAAKEVIRVETIRKDNTLASSGIDVLKVAAGVVGLLVALGAMIGKQSFIWVVLPFGLSVLAFQAVRSIRVMKFARGVGYALAAIGAVVTVTELGGAIIDKRHDAGSGLLGAFICMAVGWGIVKLMCLRYQEAGHGNLKNHFLQSLAGGAGMGGVLVGAMALFGENHQPEASNMPSVTGPAPATMPVPMSAPASTPPGPMAAFADLYGMQGVDTDKTTLPSGEQALVWYAAVVKTSAGPRYVVMMARTNSNDTSNADSGKIDAITYREEAGQWKVDAKSSELFRAGSFGIANALEKEALAKIENHPLKPGATGVFLPGSGSAQGYGTEYFDVVSVGSGTIDYLGKVETGGENSGACDNTVKDGPDACYHWTGKVQVETSRNGQPADIVVTKTGLENIDSKLVPAQQVRYVWSSGKAYSAS